MPSNVETLRPESASRRREVSTARADGALAPTLFSNEETEVTPARAR
jgi:hypothetical protein